ncbi:MAG: amidohydrolase family protein [Bacteroidales bacterium]
MQIHTGLNGGDIENSKPTHLVNLFQEYPDVKFILFHGAYPYGGELAVLAKKFTNVYIDMCWLYIISPSYSERYLHEWLETVPANKIMAFGGDFLHVEGVYSHLLLAKQIVSNVLIDKVKDGYLTENEAIKIAQMIFHDNAVRILNLKK